MEFKKNSEFTSTFPNSVSRSHSSLQTGPGGVKYFANLLEYGSNNKNSNNTNTTNSKKKLDYSSSSSSLNYYNDNDSIAKHSIISSKSMNTIGTYKSSFTLSTVPSLVIDIPKTTEYIHGKGILAAQNFATTLPIFTRDKYDLFGVGDMQFSRRNYKLFGDEEYIASKKKTADEEERLAKRKQMISEDLFILPENLNDFRFKMFDEMENSSKKQSPPTTAESGKQSPPSTVITNNASLSKPTSAGRVSPNDENANKAAKSQRRGSVDAYTVKLNKNQNMLKSEDERQKQLEFASARKKDRKEEEKYNRNRRGSTVATPKRLSALMPLNDLQSNGGNSPVDIAQASGELDNFVFRNDSTESLETSVDDMKGVYDLYIGNQAILDFQYKYKKVAAETERYPNDEDLPIQSLTPRSMYLRGTIKNSTLPLPLLIRKDNEPLGIHLAHHGLGDLKMLPLIQVIDRLPGIRTIDLSDNRLTDLTLLPLTEKLPFLKTLTHLDLSFNKIDECSKTIQDYLIQPNCILKTLILDGADVDDGECGSLAEAISKNNSIKTLSLANNLIGKTELLNILHPELITGGEALGDMLKQNKTLTKLNLAWNSIRQDSAIALAKSLEKNDSLRILLLGYNSFGDMPSQILGKALKTNKTLTELDLESNSLNPKAATVLANAISFNETIIKLNINGNTLGKIGAQALVAAIQRSSTETRKLQVSFVNCDCNQDDDNIFSAANPHGTWRMNLREPYGQMVAAECLYLANHRAGCRIVKLFYNGQLVQLERAYVAKAEEGQAGQLKKFKLEEFYKNSRNAANALLEENYEEASIALNTLLKSFNFSMNDEQRMIVLKKTFELWTVKAKREGRDDLQEVFLYEIFFSLFVINDADLSGTMDLDEFMETLASLGKTDYDRDAAKRLMSEYDRDESGTMDANEFGNIMINEFCRTEIPRGELVDASTGEPWVIPSTGYCVIQLSYQCDVPTLYDIGADHGIENIIKSIREAKTDDQREILFQNTTSSPYFFLSFEQAQLLFEEMQVLNRLPIELMASILPQIVNEEQTIKFLDTNLNEIGKLAIRLKLGPLYGAFVGLRTGHYAIDLKIPYQRNGARRLGAISVTEGKMCRQGGVTSSQKGNFSNFRNEKLGVTPVDVTARWFASANSQQNAKVLRCDYVSTDKPRKGTPIMSDIRFEKLIQQIGLEDIKKVWDRIQEKETRYFEKQAALQLQLLQQQLLLAQGGEVSTGGDDDGVSISSESNLSVPSTAKRPNRFARFMRDQNDRFKDHPVGLLTTNAGYPIDFHDFPELMMESPFSFANVKENWTEYLDTCHHFWDIYPEERMRDMSRPGYSATERPPTPEELRLAPPPNRTNLPPIFPFAYRKILELQIMFPNLYLNVQQLKILLEFFPPEEAYLRIQLIQAIFSHIVDLENMNIIIDDVLTFDERNEIFHRIGIMNLLDPMKPDRMYRLDLRRYDHREWAKILVTLALNEPGENWDGQEYRWAKYDEPVPGWTLPGTWCQADDGGVTGGPRVHGWLRLTYRSKGSGCFPVISVRKFLRKRTLAGMKKIL